MRPSKSVGVEMGTRKRVPGMGRDGYTPDGPRKDDEEDQSRLW